jgi:hypothetical protein
MITKKFMKIISLVCLIILTTSGISISNICTFEDLNLPPESYWNGSVGSGGFISGGAHFSSNYDNFWFSWDGFSYSNITDKITANIAGQYNSIAGTGHGGSPNYAVCYVGWISNPVITFEKPHLVYGLYVTNNNTAYYSMLNGSMFSKKFGGASGNDPDWFKLTIYGKDAGGIITGTVDFYLADYRFVDKNADYIIDTWRYVDLTSLGDVNSIEFGLSSSDSGAWGMNTPAYFALDTIVYQGELFYDHPYTEAGINGYIDPENNRQHAGPEDAGAITNPIFRGWASAVAGYCQVPGVASQWSDPNKTLGPATGNVGDIFSLGELSREQIYNRVSPGWITLFFDEPICNNKGYDFAVFENGMISKNTTSGGSIAGQVMAELAYVEVSSNGKDFVRFPAVSLTAGPVGPYGTIDISNVYNLAGKHPNANGICTGTPFDLQEIAHEPNVVSGIVDINIIKYVRIVDIPGTGDFYDNAVKHIDPNTRPGWDYYKNNHPIFDAWPTWGSGGFDLEAIGVLHEQQYSADIDLNGTVDVHDFELFASAWHTHFGQPGWLARCDLAEPKDMFIDMSDLVIFLNQWQAQETWCYKD